jgi:hypothetical protein
VGTLLVCKYQPGILGNTGGESLIFLTFIHGPRTTSNSIIHENENGVLQDAYHEVTTQFRLQNIFLNLKGIHACSLTKNSHKKNKKCADVKIIFITHILSSI